MVAERADAEEANHVLQRFRLRGKLFRGAGQFLCTSGIPLRDKTNLTNGPVDLAHAGCLLAGGGSNFLYEVGSFLNCGNQFVEQTAGAFRDLHVRSRQPANFLSCCSAAFREVTYFTCDNSEATP